MKVLFVFNRGEIGGATKAMLNTISGLDKSKIQPIIISPNKKGYVFEYCKNNNIEFFYIKYFEIGYAFNDFNIKKFIKLLLLPIFWILNRIYNYYGIKKLSKLIDLNSISCIHTNTNRDDFGLYISKKLKKKHILHLREFDTDFFNLKYVRRNIYNYFNANTNVFIAVSEAVKNYYINKGIDAKKIKVVYDGIDTDKIEKKDNLNDEKTKVIMLSNIAENKGQIQLIEAINILDKEIRDNISVDFYGTGSSNYISNLKKIIEKYSLDKQIRFMGYQQNVYKVLKNYDIGVTASKIEGFGLVTVEYMAAGLCTIVSDTGANVEIIDDYNDGLIYHFNDISDLKSKLTLIIKNQDLAKKIVSNAQQKVNKYSIIENVLKMEIIYKEILRYENQ